MPFISIALLAVLLFGGSAYATTTPQGHAAMQNAEHVWAEIVGGQATTSLNISL